MDPTLVSAWTAARRRLEAAGIDSPAIDARLLLESAAEVSRGDILTDPHRVLSAPAAARLEGFVARREAREPVSQILGRRAFWTIVLKVTGDVLTPRPETESLLDLVFAEFAPDRRFSVLDLGVGSGALLLAILAERPHARGLGVDVSEAALAVARENAANLGLGDRAALLRGDWTAGLADDGFDLVVANPPYIPTAEIETLAPEVRDHEPRLALDGGPDGLDAYRQLAPEILRVLKPGGRFVLEIGSGQGRAVRALFEAAGAHGLTILPDLATRERVVAGVKKALGNPSSNR
jgi:release factor glutamine methyltransferase